ncbi:hypothetical protein [Botrimarina colliarenosi]|nr:hypothetical protein [Botrimarina colliarenosi]
MRIATICTLASAAFSLIQEKAVADEPLRRLTARGLLVSNTASLTKWSTKKSHHNIGEKGDLFAFSVRLDPGERLTVGVYLYATPLKLRANGLAGGIDGPERPVPVSEIGAKWGHKSQSLHCAGSWVMVDNPSTYGSEETVAIFLPYAVIGLADGPYIFRYRIRVINRVDGSVFDSFFAKYSYSAFVKPGSLVATSSLASKLNDTPFVYLDYEGVKEEEEQGYIP